MEDVRAQWRARLPRLVDEYARRWSLRPSAPFPVEHAYVAPATLADGGEAILKLGLPHEEAEHEADALAFWDGRGAVRLLASDPGDFALLLERCVPGEPLLRLPLDEALAVAAGILRRLWRPPPDRHPFRLLADEAARWRDELDRVHPSVEPRVLDEALAALRDLPGSQPELVVCHQDLHLGNVLSARREPWLAIDPKPLVGEPAFDCVSLLRNHPSERVLDRLVRELELDRERVRGWAVAHALAWETPAAARALATSRRSRGSGRRT